jgi:hypothetical protein
MWDEQPCTNTMLMHINLLSIIGTSKLPGSLWVLYTWRMFQQSAFLPRSTNVFLYITLYSAIQNTGFFICAQIQIEHWISKHLIPYKSLANAYKAPVAWISSTLQYDAPDELSITLTCWELYVGPLIPLHPGEITEIKQTKATIHTNCYVLDFCNKGLMFISAADTFSEP